MAWPTSGAVHAVVEKRNEAGGVTLRTPRVLNASERCNSGDRSFMRSRVCTASVESHAFFFVIYFLCRCSN